MNEGVQMEATDKPDLEPVPKPQFVYRCKKCRRIVASEEIIVPHEPKQGEQSFKWKRREVNLRDDEPVKCSSIFVEPMKWMETVHEGFVGEKLMCIGCNSRLGSFNWAGMQCNCGTWVIPAFQLHKSRLDECRIGLEQQIFPVFESGIDGQRR